MVFTESWLESTIPDTAINLAGDFVHRVDRTAHSGKKRGGGICIFVIMPDAHQRTQRKHIVPLILNI